MSSIQSTPKGYRAQVAIKGQRDSATFATKREAQQWAAKREIQLRTDATGLVTTKTLSDAFRRYGEEVSPKRRGEHWELVRLAAFERSVLPVKLRLSSITADHIAAWRDVRLSEVSPASVLRDVSLLSAVFEAARRDWKWIQKNPTTDIRKPPKPAHRERTIKWHEIKRMLRALDYHPGKSPQSSTQAIGLCFIAALRTGMRAGELAKLEWCRVHSRHVHLDTTKSGHVRDVPLSSKARRTIAQAQGWDAVRVFGLKSTTLDVLFRRARDKAGLEGFTFHDARHTAATWIGRSGKLEMLEMCKMFGWRDPRHALIYFNPTASDLADKLG